MNWMTTRLTSRHGLGAALLALTFLDRANAQNAVQSGTPSIPGPKREVVVSVPDRKLAVLEDGKVLRVFAVAVGAEVSPSPVGQFQIVQRLTDPTYYHPGVVIPPGKDNPLGPRWVGLNQKGFGIHGTNQPGSVGYAKSHGCIRMRNRDIVEFFAMVRVGDTVEIRSERDEQIAQIFGGTASPTVVTAQIATTAAAGGGH